MPKSRQAIDRFNEKWTLDQTTGCWLWTGHIRKSDGYTAFKAAPYLTMTAHKWRWEHEHGPVPRGLQLDHLCRVRHCVNPAHLQLVTPRENTLRGDTFQARNAAVTHCPQGHPLSGNNLYQYPDGRRACRICRADYIRRFKAAAKQRKQTA